MANVCCVTGCTVAPATDVYYFPLPTKPALRRRWLAVIKPDSKLGLGASVCSAHFSTTDYETVRGKTRLKKNKVPMTIDELKSQSDEHSNHSNQSAESTKSDPQTKTDTTSKEKDKSEKEMEVEENGVKEGEKETDSQDAEMVEAPETNGDRDDHDPSSIEIQITPDIIEDYNTLHVTPDIIEGDNTLKPPDPLDPDINDDIEDILTNYHIMNPPDRRDRETKPGETPGPGETQDTCHKAKESPDKSETTKPPSQPDKSSEALPETPEKPSAKPNDDVHTIDDDDDLPLGVLAKPVFIEINVDKERTTETDAGGDCLMVLESLQCSIDPRALLPPEPEEPGSIEEIEIRSEDEDEDKNHDPISLLTSSDEDEVIIEEPHIDTVEVSDETDEDDVPLVKLVKPRFQPATDLTKIFWGSYDYYCSNCHYVSLSYAAYKKHLLTHSAQTAVMQVCQTCGYTTASEYQFSRHRKKHRDERRFKCHLCDYKARHNMSLMYHLKTHDDNPGKATGKYYRCERCKFKSNDRSKTMKHMKTCRKEKTYGCGQCSYSTKRRSDLKRHQRRHQHQDDDDEWT